MTDSSQAYFRQIAAFPLINRRKEQSLAEKIMAGKKAKKELAELEKKKGMFRKKAEKLRQKIKIGIEAKKDLTNANLRLVVSIAKNYLVYTWKLRLGDLISAGNMELVRAAGRFHGKNRFSTYATKCIRGAILNAIFRKRN